MTNDRWITFDCYGTLLDWQTAFRQILEPAAHGRVDELVEAFHEVAPDVEAKMQNALYKDILHEGLRRSGERAEIPLGEADLDLLVREWHRIRAFDDTVEALEELKRQGWKLGILTNCDNDLFEATRDRLGVQIDLVVTAEEVKGYKPSFGHFTEFERRSQAARANWVHAAVSWWHDMVPAKDLGLRCVWVDRENSGHDASVVTARITSMAELPAVTRRFLESR
ncbi:HAD family hydrolase [Streptomyces asiaticus]|uniref:HAD family hydrolase n=1 Tax=Streptomyces asiaticus TaxID=114695 RepID=UPI003D75A8A3